MVEVWNRVLDLATHNSKSHRLKKAFSTNYDWLNGVVDKVFADFHMSSIRAKGHNEHTHTIRERLGRWWKDINDRMSNQPPEHLCPAFDKWQAHTEQLTLAFISDHLKEEDFIHDKL